MTKDIRITVGEERYSASKHMDVPPAWQKLSTSEFLYKFCLKNLQFYAKEEGKEDEPVKVLKAPNGKTVFTEGDVSVTYDNITYTVEETDDNVTQEEEIKIEPFNPLRDLTDIQKQEVERIRAHAFHQGYESVIKTNQNAE